MQPGTIPQTSGAAFGPQFAFRLLDARGHTVSAYLTSPAPRVSVRAVFPSPCLDADRGHSHSTQVALSPEAAAAGLVLTGTSSVSFVLGLVRARSHPIHPNSSRFDDQATFNVTSGSLGVLGPSGGPYNLVFTSTVPLLDGRTRVVIMPCACWNRSSCNVCRPQLTVSGSVILRACGDGEEYRPELLRCQLCQVRSRLND